MGSTIASTRRLSLKQSHGRVANAVADLLRRKLTVPEIYLQPRLPGSSGIDVLAVNHAGSGDIHGVEIAFTTDPAQFEQPEEILERLKQLSAHFKYIAMPAAIASSPAVRDMFTGADGFSEDGIGRLGLIAYPASLLDAAETAASEAALLITVPERFVLRGENLSQMEHFLETVTPDIRVRI